MSAVGDRVIEYDLLFLRAVLNWAVKARLVDANPLRGLAVPKERNPHRPVLSDEARMRLLPQFAWEHLTESVRFCGESVGAR